MIPVDPILIGKSQEECYLLPGFANRHGLIHSATGAVHTPGRRTAVNSSHPTRQPSKALCAPLSPRSGGDRQGHDGAGRRTGQPSVVFLQQKACDTLLKQPYRMEAG